MACGDSCLTAAVTRGIKTNMTLQEQQAHGKYAHAGSRTRVTSMGGLYDTVTLHAREDMSENCIVNHDIEVGAESKHLVAYICL